MVNKHVIRTLSVAEGYGQAIKPLNSEKGCADNITMK